MDISTDNKIEILTETMLGLCESKSVDFILGVSKSEGYDLYELSIRAHDDDSFMSSKIDLVIFFSFESTSPNPYISINYSDVWYNSIKSFDLDFNSRIESRVIELYKHCREEQFDDIFRRTIDYFDIDESLIRDIKIKKILNNE